MDDLGDSAFIDVVLSCEGLLWGTVGMGASDLAYLGNGEFGIVDVFTGSGTFSVDGILHILFLGTWDEVVWADAEWGIAGMADELAWWDRADECFVGESVSGDSLLTWECNAPIACA